MFIYVWCGFIGMVVDLFCFIEKGKGWFVLVFFLLFYVVVYSVLVVFIMCVVVMLKCLYSWLVGVEVLKVLILIIVLFRLMNWC